MEPFKSFVRYRTTAFAILIGGFLSAQTDTISSDRPDRTQGTGTLKKKNFQIENGVTFGSEDLMNNFMLRYGLTDNTEIRLLIDAGKEEGVKGIMPVTLGLKQRIAEENGPLPAVAFVGSLMIQPLATKDFRDTGVDFMLRLAFDHELSDKWSFGYNVAAANLFKELKLTGEFSYAPGGRWSGYAEYFSTYSKQQPEHNVDVGVFYLINPRLQLDLAVGRSIFNPDTRAFGTFGVSYLIRAKTGGR